MESLDRLGQRLGEVCQLGLELADSFAALAGQFGRIGLVVGDRVGDEDRHGPEFSGLVFITEFSVMGRDHGHRFAHRVAAFGDDLTADVLGDLAYVLHHGRDVGEDLLVLALENVVRCIALRADDERVVDESLAQRVDGGDGALECELLRDFLQSFLHVV